MHNFAVWLTTWLLYPIPGAAALAEFERGHYRTYTRRDEGISRPRGMRRGLKPKLSRRQIDFAKKPVEDRTRRQDVTGLHDLRRSLLYRVLC